MDNELSLFFALNRYAEKHGFRHDSNENGNGEEALQVNVDAGPSNRPPDGQPAPTQRVQENTIRDAVKKIRFLTLTPQQFADGPARTQLLSQSEAFAILMNISTTNSVYPMPEGFTLNKNSRVPFETARTPSPLARPSAPPNQSAISVSVPQHAPIPAPSSPVSIVLPSPPLPYQAESPIFFNILREQRVADERRYYYCIRSMHQIREVKKNIIFK